MLLLISVFRYKCKSINTPSSSTEKNNQEMNTYFTIEETAYERIGPQDHHQYQDIFQISSTEDCNDKNTQYLTVVSIEENSKTNERLNIN